jgi:hypothetical protein
MVPSNDKQSIESSMSVQPKADDRKPDDAQPSATKEDRIQGEGDYQSAREFNELERKFVASGRVAAAARDAAPTSESERQEMLEAEQQGKRRAKGEDPALTTARTDSATPKVPRED